MSDMYYLAVGFSVLISLIVLEYFIKITIMPYINDYLQKRKDILEVIRLKELNKFKKQIKIIMMEEQVEIYKEIKELKLDFDMNFDMNFVRVIKRYNEFVKYGIFRINERNRHFFDKLDDIYQNKYITQLTQSTQLAELFKHHIENIKLKITNILDNANNTN